MNHKTQPVEHQPTDNPFIISTTKGLVQLLKVSDYCVHYKCYDSNKPNNQNKLDEI